MLYTAQINFRDENMAALSEIASTEAGALLALRGLFTRFAGLRSGCIITPDGEKHVYSGAGVYLFTVPNLEGIKNE